MTSRPLAVTLAVSALLGLVAAGPAAADDDPEVARLAPCCKTIES
ncbi:hypothetical protein [Cellulomonas massiliensis]|nr:hypothetical protein [Cellulomonas massiliensis]